ncbi:MAG: carbohydrate porin [Candidatus Parcubacteria bacterium]|nr:carbohydrate porin [Leptolyngbyaceae cyanobacterium LF-bin-113]
MGNASTFQTGGKNNIPLHLEAFYRCNLSDNISITPGLIWIVSPGQDSSNQDAVIGTVRTTFTF